MCMAEALPADGELVSLEICEHLKTLAAELISESQHAGKIHIILEPAIKFINRIAETKEKFDMIFVDGEKADYVPLFKMIFDNDLLSTGGTLLIDNAYNRGGAYNPSLNDRVPQELLDTVKAWQGLHTILLPLSDGLWMIRRMKDVERDAL
ncbi:caffeoyl-CoA o-methyltransferase [Plakobranchus ocellatus]|uniref:Caffeoyl-CoA o-methyltransferase n=1 Tax=Plakobranchus ocellatus TaxID=259542 RepID=A0AAV4BPJ3_9GAST|nr:caffeoyl-CoA o-methyltransferase [Plakobranchus ocellatus]